jgi:hypothetical protein
LKTKTKTKSTKLSKKLKTKTNLPNVNDWNSQYFLKNEDGTLKKAETNIANDDGEIFDFDEAFSKKSNDVINDMIAKSFEEEKLTGKEIDSPVFKELKTITLSNDLNDQQLNIKISINDIKNIEKINVEQFYNELAPATLGRIILKKGIEYFISKGK